MHGICILLNSFICGMVIFITSAPHHLASKSGVVTDAARAVISLYSAHKADMKSLDRWSSILRYFLLPCIWFLTFFSGWYLSVCTWKMEKMETKTDLKRKKPQGRRNYLNMLLQRSKDFISGTTKKLTL